MKTTIKKAMQFLTLLGMLLPAIPSATASESSTISTETKNAVVASTPRILVVAQCEWRDPSNGAILKTDMRAISSGSGFLIHRSSRDAYVLTNAHVLYENGEKLGEDKVNDKEAGVYCKKVYHLAFFPNGANDPRIYVAQEVVCKNKDRDQQIDIGVLRIPSDDLPPALKIDTRELDETQPVVAAGYPGKFDRFTSFLASGPENNPLIATLQNRLATFNYAGGYITVPFNVSDRDFVNTAISMGNIIRYDKTPGKPQRVIHSAPIDRGNSGGPLVDPTTGYVVGINTGGLKDDSTSSVAQSSATITGFLNSNNIPYEVPEGSMDANWLLIGLGGAGLVLLLIITISVKVSGNKKTAVTLYADGRSITLTMGQVRKGVLIGRSSKADVTLPQPTVSANHARIIMHENKLYIMDIGSKGGTKLNGTQLQPNKPAQLHPGSTIMLTNVELKIR